MPNYNNINPFEPYNCKELVDYMKSFLETDLRMVKLVKTKQIIKILRYVERGTNSKKQDVRL